MGNYWLHRISSGHSKHADIAYALAEKNIITFGWPNFSETDILDTARKKEYKAFVDQFKEVYGEDYRGKNCIWRFAKFNKDDIVVVPERSQKFSIYKILEPAESIFNLENCPAELEDVKRKGISYNEGKLYYSDNSIVDIGFMIKVNKLASHISRVDYADSALTSRMKVRLTNVCINNIRKSVDNAIAAWQNNEPVNFYNEVSSKMADNLSKSILETLDDRKFEKLISWYMKNIGADNVYIPSKNEKLNGNSKKDYADADIIAVFEQLKFVVYIQAKHHCGTTNDWAVEQIQRYAEQIDVYDDGYTCASWVISSADNFTESAIELAEKSKVRLINGKDFAKMLIDSGVANINSAF